MELLKSQKGIPKELLVINKLVRHDTYVIRTGKLSYQGGAIIGKICKIRHDSSSTTNHMSYGYENVEIRKQHARLATKEEILEYESKKTRYFDIIPNNYLVIDNIDNYSII